MDDNSKGAFLFSRLTLRKLDSRNILTLTPVRCRNDFSPHEVTYFMCTTVPYSRFVRTYDFKFLLRTLLRCVSLFRFSLFVCCLLMEQLMTRRLNNSTQCGQKQIYTHLLFIFAMPVFV
jgi:hypothetical protein